MKNKAKVLFRFDHGPDHLGCSGDRGCRGGFGSDFGCRFGCVRRRAFFPQAWQLGG